MRGFYEASSLGRVRSVERRAANGRLWPTHVLKPVEHPNGHLQVHLSRNNARRTHWVHILVLTVFAGPPPEGMEVLHRDGIASNNAATNLRWGTRSENGHDQVRHGVHYYAARTHCPKGHPYDAANTYNEPGVNHRKCRECMRAQAKRANERRRTARRAAREEAA